MFVLRFKPDTYRLLSKDGRNYESVNIGGQYFCDRPTVATGYSTTDISKAKVFNEDADKIGVRYFADTEIVPVKIVIL